MSRNPRASRGPIRSMRLKKHYSCTIIIPERGYIISSNDRAVSTCACGSRNLRPSHFQYSALLNFLRLLLVLLFHIPIYSRLSLVLLLLAELGSRGRTARPGPEYQSSPRFCDSLSVQHNRNVSSRLSTSFIVKMSLDFGLKDVHVLITGSAGGIGLETVKTFQKLGARITAHYSTCIVAEMVS